MQSNKIILALVGVAVLGGGLFLLKGKSTTPTEQKTKEVMEKVEEANKKVEKKVPSGLKSCTAEILANAGNCINLPKEMVCGYDHTVYGDGKEADHGLTYNNSCSYCQFFGADGVMDIVDTKVTALGYAEGECE